MEEEYEKDREKFPEPDSTFNQFLMAPDLSPSSFVFANGISSNNAKAEVEEAATFREFYPPPIMGSTASFLFQHQQQQVTSSAAVDSVYENHGADAGTSENHFAALSMGETSARAPDCGRKRRFTNVMMEKSIERRQKRMIKNRESAARSRAKKQAYTQQLEQEVDQLKKMNSWLKMQKELDMIISSNTKQRQYQLRRTSSATF